MKRVLGTMVLLCTSILTFAQYTLTLNDVVFENGVITDYTGSATDIIIPDHFEGIPVTTIGDYAFSENQLKTIDISSSITTIGQYAFAINQLTSVEIPNSVTSIGRSAFRSNQFTWFNLPKHFEGHIHSWENKASWNGPADYESGDMVSTDGFYEIEEQLKRFGYELTLDDVIFENGVITDYINTEKKDIIIPNNFNSVPVTTIGDEAFRLNQLTSVVIPNSVIEIGASAFSYNQLENITIPNTVTTISNEAFAQNQLTSVEIPNSVTSIGESAFWTNRLTNVLIPNSVTSISQGAFLSNQLKSITIPNSVTHIGQGAFSSNQLTSIEIPNSVTSIGDMAFYRNQFDTFNLPAAYEGYTYSWNDGEYQSGEEVPVRGAYEIGEAIGVVTSNDKTSEVLSFYPNPAAEHINVNANGSTFIYSLDGVLQITSQHSKIDVSSLESGVYLIQQGYQKTKFIKQ